VKEILRFSWCHDVSEAERLATFFAQNVTHPETIRFWRHEFPSYTKTFRSEAVAPILNKAGQITASPQLRLILGRSMAVLAPQRVGRGREI
jgi:hypothetical protein